MEPMNLGSAPSSPSSPGANPNYLPAFLMGEHQPSTPNPALSPDLKRKFSYKINSSSPEQGNLRHRLFSPGTNLEQTPVASPSIDLHSDKPGPPKHGLFDTLDHKTTPNTPIFNNKPNFIAESPAQLDLSKSAVYNNYSLSERNEPLCNSNLFNTTDIVHDLNPNLWITVFGFPSNCAGVVLARFSNCGTIIEKRFPSQGNWAHLKYTSPQEAARALSLNGKLISNNIMVGVIQHQNKEGNKENQDLSMYASPMRARSLRQSLASPQNINTVLPPQNVPQKSTGLVTKAMEYVFGW